MLKNLLSYALVCGLLAFAGCSYENEEELFGAADDIPDEVSLTDNIVPIINSKCALSGCHVSGSTFPNLSVRNNIIANAGRIKTRTRPGGGMPQTGSISNQQRDLIGRWVDQGAMDN